MCAGWVCLCVMQSLSAYGNVRSVRICLKYLWRFRYSICGGFEIPWCVLHCHSHLVLLGWSRADRPKAVWMRETITGKGMGDMIVF